MRALFHQVRFASNSLVAISALFFASTRAQAKILEMSALVQKRTFALLFAYLVAFTPP